MGALSAMKGPSRSRRRDPGAAGSWSLYSPSGTPAPVLAPWTSCSHGLRNELYFCAQVAPQAGSVLVFFTDKELEIPLP